MYKGKNQEQYIAKKYRKTYLHALWRSSPPSVLKGFSLGIHAFRKGAWYSFGVLKDMEKFAFLIRGRMYRGENYRGKTV